MRSIKTTVTAAAVVTAGFVLTAPAAHAATAPQAKSSSCRSAIATAEEAKHAYESAAADLKTQIAAGGHPGTAEEQNVTDLLNTAKTAVWNAMQVCKGMHEHHHRHPHGAMHAGVGSTSRGVNGGELAGGAGLLGAAGAGALVLRRRRAGADSAS